MFIVQTQESRKELGRVDKHIKMKALNDFKDLFIRKVVNTQKSDVESLSQVRSE